MIIADKLKKGDEIRVIAPSRSLGIVSKENRAVATEVLEKMGLKVTFSKNCDTMDEFASSSVEERIEDLHEAFLDKNVKGILTAIGGFNVNQILDRIDYDIVKNNPKILCGYSDITALTNAIYKKTGLVTYSGAHYSTFGMIKGIDYTIEHFKKCLLSNEEYTIENSEDWSDDHWYMDQENRKFHKDEGIKILKEGQGEGTIIGGNLCTLNLLQGTEYMPDLSGSILFIEDDGLTFPENFDRDLQSLIHQKNFDKVKGIVIGKFQIESKMTDELLEKLLLSKPALANIPVMYNVSFGHTTPQTTFPIGGHAKIDTAGSVKITIDKH